MLMYENIVRLNYKLYMYYSLFVLGLLMIMATGRELMSKQQAGVLDRPSDNIHLNVLVKQLPSLKVDTREPPFNRPSVAKARLLLHAHLERIEIQDPGLLNGINKQGGVGWGGAGEEEVE